MACGDAIDFRLCLFALAFLHNYGSDANIARNTLILDCDVKQRSSVKYREVCNIYELYLYLS